jgi:gluconokinase
LILCVSNLIFLTGIFGLQASQAYFAAYILGPPQNVAKMAAGTPLSDAEREPWLREISQRINLTEGNQVITCSALRRRYRDILRTADARVRFLHLSGSRDVLGSRLGGRTDHFMPSSLLASQLDTLEPLGPYEDGVSVDIRSTQADILARALQALNLDARPLLRT